MCSLAQLKELFVPTHLCISKQIGCVSTSIVVCPTAAGRGADSPEALLKKLVKFDCLVLSNEFGAST